MDQVYSEQYVGATYLDQKKTIIDKTAKYIQMKNIEALSKNANTAVAGDSGEADSALMFAEYHPVGALMLLGLILIL